MTVLLQNLIKENNFDVPLPYLGAVGFHSKGIVSY